MRMERDHAELVQDLQLEGDAVRSECRGHLLRPLRHEAAQVHGGLLDRGHAHEGEIILDELVQAREVRLDLRERFGNRRLARGGGLAEFFLQEIDLEKDHPEGIADFMRDPGGEAAQANHVKILASITASATSSR